MNKKEVINTNHDFDWFKKIMTYIFIGILSVLGGICGALILYFGYCWIRYTILTFEECGIIFRILALATFCYVTAECFDFLTCNFFSSDCKNCKY